MQTLNISHVRDDKDPKSLCNFLKCSHGSVPHDNSANSVYNLQSGISVTVLHVRDVSDITFIG